MNGIDEFVENLHNNFDKSKPVVIWVVCKSVNWPNRTMDAEGVIDELQYYNVNLGLGTLNIKPVVGAMCLVAIIGGNAAETKLIDAAEIEMVEFVAADTKVTVQKKGVSISRKDEGLKKVMNDFIDEVSKIIVVQGTTINVAKMTKIKQRLNSILID